MLTRKFVNAVAERAKVPAESVRSVLAAVQGVTVDQLRTDGEVRIPGLVSLKLMSRSERTARNPKTGDVCTVEAGHTLKSKPVSTLASLAIDKQAA